MAQRRFLRSTILALVFGLGLASCAWVPGLSKSSGVLKGLIDLSRYEYIAIYPASTDEEAMTIALRRKGYNVIQSTSHQNVPQVAGDRFIAIAQCVSSGDNADKAWGRVTATCKVSDLKTATALYEGTGETWAPMFGAAKTRGIQLATEEAFRHLPSSPRGAGLAVIIPQTNATVPTDTLTPPRTAGQQARHRIAVLEFENLTKEPGINWMREAVPETLTTKLHAVRGIQIVERRQLPRIFKEHELGTGDLFDPGQVAKVGHLLGADSLVSGSYAKAGRVLRFTAKFVDTATGTVLATSRADAIVADEASYFAAIDKLADATIESLNARVAIVGGERITIAPDERARMRRSPTVSLEAQEALGFGISAYRLYRREDAANEFRRAVKADPEYVDAWAMLSRVLVDLRRPGAAQAAAERAVAIFQSRGDPRGEAYSLTTLGRVHLLTRRFSDAATYLERALAVAKQLDASTQIDPLANLGFVAYELRRYSDARDLFVQALRLAESVGDQGSVGRILNSIGFIELDQGRIDNAEASLQKSLESAGRTGDKDTQSYALTNLGRLRATQGRYPEALGYLEQSFRIAQTTESDEEATVAVNIASVYQLQGRYSEAGHYAQKALALARSKGNIRLEISSILAIGRIHHGNSEYDEALARYLEALALSEREDDIPSRLMALTNASAVVSYRGDKDRATSLLEQARDLARSRGTEGQQLEVCQSLGRQYQLNQRFADARKELEACLALAERTQANKVVPEILASLSVALTFEGRLSEAYTRAQRSLDLAQPLGEASLVMPLVALGTVRQAQKQFNEAARYLDRAVEAAERSKSIDRELIFRMRDDVRRRGNLETPAQSRPELTGTFVGEITATMPGGNAVSMPVSITITRQGDTIQGTWVTRGSGGTLNGRVDANTISALRAVQSSPCQGEFKGAALVEDGGNSLRGHYSGIDCTGSVTAEFVITRQQLRSGN